MKKLEFTELEQIILNLNIAVERGEMTYDEAVDLLNAFQDHEFEAIAEHTIILPQHAPKFEEWSK